MRIDGLYAPVPSEDSDGSKVIFYQVKKKKIYYLSHKALPVFSTYTFGMFPHLEEPLPHSSFLIPVKRIRC